MQSLLVPTSIQSFRRLLAAFSKPVLGLLLLPGGVASLGCERSGLKQRSEKPDAALAAETNRPEPDADNSPPPKGRPPMPTDAYASIVWKLDAAPRPDTNVPDHDAPTRGDGGGVVTIQNIMESCNVEKGSQDLVLRCLTLMDDSWTPGITQALAGTSCQWVNEQLDCFLYGATSRCGQGDEFVAGTTPVCRPI